MKTKFYTCCILTLGLVFCNSLSAAEIDSHLRYLPSRTVDAMSGKIRITTIDSKYSYKWKAFEKLPGISLHSTVPGVKHAHHLFTIMVDPTKRDSYLHALQDCGVGVAVNFRPIHLLSYYRKKYGYQQNSFPMAEQIGAATITLPLYPRLTDEEVTHVIRTVVSVVSE